MLKHCVILNSLRHLVVQEKYYDMVTLFMEINMVYLYTPLYVSLYRNNLVDKVVWSLGMLFHNIIPWYGYVMMNFLNMVRYWHMLM